MNQKVSRRAIASVVAGKLLDEPAKRDHWLKTLAAFLVENNMADQADMISNDIAHEIFVRSGELLVEVTSARPLNDTVRSELSAYLQQQTNASKVVLSEKTDVSLIGGLVARTPDQELDTSVRSQLKQLATINF